MTRGGIKYKMKGAIKYKMKKILFAQYQQDIKLKINIALVYFLSSLIIFSLFRFLFYTVYHDVFLSVSPSDVVFSFIYGLRFDISVISMFLGFLTILLFIPFVQKSTKFLKICVLLMTFSITVLMLLLSGDFFYFPEVSRHMTEDLIIALAEKEFVVKYAFQYYWWVLILIFSVSIFTIMKVFKCIDKKFNPKPVSLLKGVIIFISSIFFVILGIRENFSGRPINLDTAYSLKGDLKLILNGVFTQIHVLGHKIDGKISKYPLSKAVKNTQKLLLSSSEFIPSDKYPLMRQIKNPKKAKNYNVFVVLLESWTPRFIDSLGNSTYGVTPNFDKIVKDGVVFTNAYANGYKSILGISASFLGIPVMPGVLHELEIMNKVSSMPEVFNRRGYFTMFAQSSPRNSLKMGNFSKNVLHVQECYGKEDMPVLMEYLYDLDFGYDYDLFDFAARKVSSEWRQGHPFFVFSFTGSTHVGFDPTTEEFDKYPSTTGQNRYLNTLFYSDYSVGHLIDMAKKDGWFDDTIFIFMADHVLGVATTDTLENRFKIPFVIYAPKILKPRKIDYVVSQADLLPTIYHFMGIQEPFSAIGTNALDEQSDHFALINSGADIIFVKDNNYIKHNRSILIETSLDRNSDELEQMQETLLSLDKALIVLLKSNKWYKE
jgi:phosphoglycerol transferase MdoB-like AlkP superfamily enzyme